MLNRLRKFLLSLPIIKQLIALLERIRFPGFPEASLMDVFRRFRDSLSSSRISMRAAAVSFNFFMAIFPSVIFMFTLTAYLPIEDFDVRLLDALQQVLPPASYMAVKNTILDIISQQRGGLLSLGVLVALFYSINGVKSVIDSFNSSSIVRDTRPVFKIYLVSLALTLFIIILLVLAIALMIFTNLALDFLIDKGIITYGINYALIVAGKWIIFYSLILFSVAFLYYLGPPRHTRMRFLSLGALATSFLMLLLIVGFGFFVKNFGTYNTVYGSVGALIALLALINLSSMLLLAGYEFNLSVKGLAARRDTEAGIN
ncbi:MAG: YihY/virulence factor BrkB family protein [Bacteroidetes bacterium]|nr:YihY/virulence factor BrkB family protein [Bacteroidota bacterium]